MTHELCNVSAMVIFFNSTYGKKERVGILRKDRDEFFQINSRIIPLAPLFYEAYQNVIDVTFIIEKTLLFVRFGLASEW